MAFHGNIHEGEYVSIPSRLPLPINSTSESSIPTPVRIPTPVNSPGLGIQRNSLEDLEDKYPSLIHKWSHTHSILCVVPSPSRNLIFCGTQNSKILVFDIINYNLKYEIDCGHKDNSTSILCMAMNESENFLFSAGSDSLIKVWDISGVNDKGGFTITHIIYLLVDIGDVFSISWSDSLSTLFIGAQNASILWCRLGLYSSSVSDSLSTIDRLPHFRYDKFFDSKGPGGSVNYLQTRHQLLKSTSMESSNEIYPKLIEVNNEDIIRFAHNGYIYCMCLLNSHEDKNDFIKHYSSRFENLLITGGGDGLVIIWGIILHNKSISLEKLEVLSNDESVLSMSIQDSYLYVGLSEPCINVWDLMTSQLIRSIHFSNEQNFNNKYDEVLSLGIYNDCIFKASNLGGLIKFTLKSNPPNLVDAEQDNLNRDKSSMVIITDEDHTYNNVLNKSNLQDGGVLSVRIFTSTSGITYLVSGGHKALCLWDITNLGSESQQHLESSTSNLSSNLVDNEHLLKSLRKFISYKTILKFPTLFLEDSRRCSQFLSNLLIKLGATLTRLLPVRNGNPVVYSSFSRNTKDSSKPNKRILWYAHYDVVDATSDSCSWSTDPFVLTARDGNLYARGVSDNKGPILAAIYAVSELFHKEELSCDVVFIIEGEEECGSIGFQDVINENKQLIGDIDWIMLSNSYWLDDQTPCLNYGLRGVINASITINSDKPDRHSGVDGGVLKEPTMDLIQVLDCLMNHNRINIPNFYDDVLPLSDNEIEIYRKIENTAIKNNIKHQDVESLMAKWRNPSLTIHNIQVSGPSNNTVIPQLAKASVSIRIVPNQELEKIKKLLIKMLHDSFKSLETDNHLLIDIFHEAEPWLGDPTNLVYKILYDKIRSNWGPQVPDPLFIREGGTIPSVRFLEKCFNASAAQIPCGQASDNAHLKDEKLRIINLFKLRDILTDTLMELGSR